MVEYEIKRSYPALPEGWVSPIDLFYFPAKGSQIDSPGLDGSDASPYLPDVLRSDTEALSVIGEHVEDVTQRRPYWGG